MLAYFQLCTENPSENNAKYVVRAGGKGKNLREDAQSALQGSSSVQVQIANVQLCRHLCSSSVTRDKGFSETLKQFSCLSNFCFPRIHVDGFEFEKGFSCIPKEEGKLEEKAKRHNQTDNDERQLEMANRALLRMCCSKSSNSIHQVQKEEREETDRQTANRRERMNQRLKGER